MNYIVQKSYENTNHLPPLPSSSDSVGTNSIDGSYLFDVDILNSIKPKQGLFSGILY
jgi:hypothetical protein